MGFLACCCMQCAAGVCRRSRRCGAFAGGKRITNADGTPTRVSISQSLELQPNPTFARQVLDHSRSTHLGPSYPTARARANRPEAGWGGRRGPIAIRHERPCGAGIRQGFAFYLLSVHRSNKQYGASGCDKSKLHRGFPKGCRERESSKSGGPLGRHILSR